MSPGGWALTITELSIPSTCSTCALRTCVCVCVCFSSFHSSLLFIPSPKEGRKVCLFHGFALHLFGCALRYIPFTRLFIFLKKQMMLAFTRHIDTNVEREDWQLFYFYWWWSRVRKAVHKSVLWITYPKSKNPKPKSP